MGYYVVIAISNEKPYEFATVNGKVGEFPSIDDALETYKRKIEEYGSDNVILLESVRVRVTTDVSIIK